MYSYCRFISNSIQCEVASFLHQDLQLKPSHVGQPKGTAACYHVTKGDLTGEVELDIRSLAEGLSAAP